MSANDTTINFGIKDVVTIIENNEDIKIKFTNALLASITKRYIKGINDDVLRSVQRAIADEQSNIVTAVLKECGVDFNQWSKKYTFSDVFYNSVKANVKSTINTIVSDEIAKAQTNVEAEYKSRLEKLKTKIDQYEALLDKRIKEFSQTVDAQINSAIIKQIRDGVVQEEIGRVKALLSTLNK